MKNFISGRLLKARMPGCFRQLGSGLAGLLMLTSTNAFAQATLTTLTDAHNGTPGYKDGTTFLQAQFNFPAGIALDSSGTTLFVADYNNNAVRMVTSLGNDSTSYTSSAYTNKNGINHPIAVAVDIATNVYVLNYGAGTNGTLLEFNGFDYINYGLQIPVSTNATRLTNATALALDYQGNQYVTIRSNTVIRISTNGTSTVVGVITNTGTSLQGIVVMNDGRLALSDAGNNGIWMMNTNSGSISNNATKFTGFNGTGDVLGPPAYAAFNSPKNIAKAGNGVLVVADYNNAKVKVIDTNGTVTRLYGVNPKYWSSSYPGWSDGTVNPIEAQDTVQARQPYGLAVANDGTVYDTETYYSLLREATGTGLPVLPPPPPAPPTIWSAVTNYGQVALTWSTVSTATSYNVKRSTSRGGPYTTIASSVSTSYTDTSVINGTPYYYVVSALNSGGEGQNSAEISVTPPIPPPSAPVIGWFDYEGTNSTTLLHPVSGGAFTTFNDLSLAINPTITGVSTYFTTDGSTPGSTNGSTPPHYQDGLTNASPLPVTASPNLTIKAVNIGPGGSSAMATAMVIFQAGTPSIIGNNLAQFAISDITIGAQFAYTTDGSDPRTNVNATIVGPITSTNGLTLSLQFPVNTNSVLFQMVAFKDNYLSSSVVSQSFSTTNYAANVISFGFASGEASSAFHGAAGQTFYAPVTLTTLPGSAIYSLQFNLTVTNASNSNNAAPAITPGAFGFTSMLMKPLPPPTNFPAGVKLYTPIPPLMFIGDASSPPPSSSITNYNGTNFVNLEIVNTNLNLLGVGWLERYTQTNLYDTLAQTLITYSLAHDDLFPNSQQPNGVIVGGYSFQIPANAQPGQQYQIQIGRPSATDDGIGASGSSVYISAPTNGATAGGAPLNALKYVTVTNQLKYIAGSVYPFRWFNAGDFGSSNIVNADVEQVFQSAIYALNYPPAGSDFFDSMDSCGNIGVLDTDSSDPNNGNYTNTYASLNTTQVNALFNGNDSTINQIAFGDGVLDVCDVYVTYRRSLDPSLTWFERFWNNGQLVADTSAPNVASHVILEAATSSVSQPKVQSASTVLPKVNFTAGDITNCSPGQVVTIPINATIFGSYPLRVLMLNLTVEPLDGSPALTTPVQFTQTATVLGTPYTTDSSGNGNYAAVWLNSGNAGLTGTVTLGTLSITIPPGASANTAYDIHFDHASASPNGLASFPKQTMTGLITLSSRTNSSYGDGIPDAWRLRWFGTANNYLSVSNACPSGDGIDNYKKYVAGVDPNVANDFPSVDAKTPAPSGSKMAIHWPTVSGKQYVIERSSSLFSGNWTTIATNTGTGTDMEFDDNSTGSANFYRVLIVP